MAARENLDFRLGEDWIIGLSCRGPNGEVIDLTDGDVQFRLASATALLLDISASAANGVQITSPTAGVAVIRVTPAMQVEAEIVPGIYRYDARALPSDGTKSDQVYGSFNVGQSLFVEFT